MKRVIGFLSTAVFFTAVLLVALTGTAAAQTPPTLDHFYCYFFSSDLKFVNLTLEDQFDVALKQPETVKDLRFVRFCNPVQKTTADGKVTPIQDADGHLAMYLITPQRIIPRVVIIRNQFGTQRLRTAYAVVLAVPSGKALPAPGSTNPPPPPAIPTDIDHFKCYLASGRAVGQPVLLKDQFSTDSVLAGVLQPILFCNPVKKSVTTTTPPIITPIRNPDAHLACYVTTRRNFESPPFFFRNQFTPREARLQVSNPDILCVPSLKLRWFVVPPPSSLVPPDNQGGNSQ